MRTWRVGTFSMGASLVLLGIILFSSRFLGLDPVHVMSGWWPILLVILGIEILVYLFVSKQESPVLKYDLLSIFFVGIIGTIGIGFAIVSTSGIMGKVEEVMASDSRSFDLPNFGYQADDQVKRVVVENAGYDLSLEATAEKDVSVFGTYQVQTSNKAKPLKAANDYVAATKKGDTLYLYFKPLPKEIGPFNQPGSVAATILIPNDLQLDVHGSANSITLKPRTLANDWRIESESSVSLDVDETSNVKVSAVGVEGVSGKDGSWTVSESQKGGSEESAMAKNAVFQSGEGKFHITISKAYHISLNTN